MIYDSYADARAALLQAAKDRSATLAEHTFHGAKGRLGEPPAIDVAVVGDPGDPKALLIVSGTHGLEGLPGSGAELELPLRARMMAAFAPDDPLWRNAILERSLDGHLKALGGLAAW